MNYLGRTKKKHNKMKTLSKTLLILLRKKRFVIYFLEENENNVFIIIISYTFLNNNVNIHGKNKNLYHKKNCYSAGM
jgi:hypothetical protein